MTVSVEYAKGHFEELLDVMAAGGAISVERADKPTVILRSEPEAEMIPASAGERVLGAGRGELRVPSDEEWEQMDREWRASYMHKFDGSESP